jgi:beta-glucanase (GH16 family)
MSTACVHPISFVARLLFLFCALTISINGQIPYEKYQLSWSDEFDSDGAPNSANWGYEEGCSIRNKELQNYTRARLENARVENGVLVIEARKEKMGSCNYTSASLITRGKRSFKYGLFELRAKIDIMSGSWPAWWWLPNSGGWPKGGEIDMMEFYQGKLLFNVMDGNQRWTSKTQTVSSLGGSVWADSFHVWTWEWDSTKIDLWLDGKLMNHYLVANANGTGPNGENPFSRPGYMLINQAIGGTNGGDPSRTSFPVKCLVDYIRYYQPGKDTAALQVEDPQQGYRLFDNYPNPFNSSTVIQYSIPENCRVCIKVFDTAGREVETLIDEIQAHGTHTVTLTSNQLAGGVFFYQLQTSTFRDTKKLLVLK